MSTAFFIFAVGSCLVTSVFGSAVNFFLFYKFLKREGKTNGFQKVCLVKTLPNFVICFTFLFWVVPVTAFSFTYSQLPYRLNSIIGSLAGSWAYLFTPFLQVSLSCNRFYVLYFPFGVKMLHKVPVTNISILSSIFIVSCVCSVGLQDTCGYVYDPNYFTWRPEAFDCASELSKVILSMIYAITFTSNAFNVATGARLLVKKMVGMNREEASRRKKRWMIMFTQSVIQDCLHLFDILNATYIWKLSDELWFQFLFLTLSFIVIYTLDGHSSCYSLLKIDSGNVSGQATLAAFSQEFFSFALISCLLTCVLGSVCNVYLLAKFAAREGRSNGFQKICLAKTVPNILVSAAFLLWAIPLTLLSVSFDQVPYWLNNIIGAVVGTWAYLLTPMLQIGMSCNRCYVLYFPFGIKMIRTAQTTYIFIFIAIFSTSIVAGLTLQEGCGYVYDPELFQWRPELDECAEAFSNGILLVIIVFTFISNSFNVATLARLLMNKMIGMSRKDSRRRRKKWMIMFTQSVIQDCLHLFDILNATYFWKLSDELWFQFLFLTLSFIVIYTLDGFVMFLFSPDVQPYWFRRNWIGGERKNTGSAAVMVVSVTSVQ